MSRPGLTRLLLAGMAGLLLALLLLWLLPDRQGLRRHQWAPPAAMPPDLSAFAGAMQRRPPTPAAEAVGRPLFTPTRRPPPPPAPAASAPPAAAPPPPPDQLDKTRLLGVISGRGLAGVIASVDGETRTVHRGEAIGGWRLDGIDDRQVSFVRDGERRTLLLENTLLSPDAGTPPAAAAAPAAPGARPALPPGAAPPPGARRPAR
ncbi:hypothetical protein [Ottowia sp.]|jgi:hypothetical protein|uniref:hypothetical protein n=1 Tax=Ottowia sp. TaxID=1898956 RepID=UPI002C58EDCB|nr:hypothetical protein [Ottowia sp.]HRN75290.1 hypothetical protein [Ottowia sp.]HRQ02488.1 hypothetical protein [Ottowia sp.]